MSTSVSLRGRRANSPVDFADELEPLPAPASSHRRPMSASPANNGKGFMATRKPLAMHQNSSQVANLWNPVTGVRDAQRRAGMTPVNHARDNLLAIKELSLKNKAKRELAEANKQAPAFKARPAPSSRSSSRTVRPVSAAPARWPATCSTFSNQSPEKYGTDFVESNKAGTLAKAVAAGRLKMEQSELRELEKEQNSPLLKPNYGKVPVYVLERRKEVAAKVAQLAKEKALANVPPGMRVMPDEEREATLVVLRANRADVEGKLASLPIAVGQTQFSLRKKSELEHRLGEIEDAQRVFQRRVVLVRDE